MDVRRLALPFLLISMAVVLFVVSFGILPDPVCSVITLQLYNLPCVLIVFVLWILSISAFLEFLNENPLGFYVPSSVFFAISFAISWTWARWFLALVAVSFLIAVFGILENIKKDS
ncbi:hypothetical protein [Thermococcus sp.]|uniref:hypothetical protein n=1 Tax=Thermococcus sp. TaxID=35749 RepID=UPI002632A6B6|nr:hypothetical protein [Thermococcus sp.]